MKKEIIIPRKKSKSIKFSIGMFLSSLLLLLPIILYFKDFEWITAEVPLFVVILCIPCSAVCAFCSIAYFKEIFNNKPVLIVNKNGIHEETSRNSVGMIKWRDIKNINIIPYMDNTYFIGIVLKEPEKYITDSKRLIKIKRKKTTNKWGHVYFSSLYFKKEFNEINELMKHYFSLSKEENEFDIH